jgi:hypothetical protein
MEEHPNERARRQKTHHFEQWEKDESEVVN